MMIVMYVAFSRRSKNKRREQQAATASAARPIQGLGLGSGEEPAWDNARHTLTLSSARSVHWDEPASSGTLAADLESARDGSSV